MQQDSQNTHGRKITGWVAASLVAHALVAGLLLVDLPKAGPVTPPESISVDLVPPPLEAKPETAEPEQKALVVPKVAEPQSEMTPPVAEDVKPPEKPQEPAKAKEAPTAEAPSKAEELAKTEEPPAERPPTPEPEPPPAPVDPPMPAESPKPAVVETDLRKVDAFGEKDSGPRKTDAGDSPDEAQPDAAETAADTAEVDTPAGADAPAAAAPAADQPEVAAPVPHDTAVLSAAASDASTSHGPAKPDGPASPADPEQAGDGAVLPRVVPIPTAKPRQVAKSGPAKKLFSTSDTGEILATTAMGTTSRGERFNELCKTRLERELKKVGYPPIFVPSYKLGDQTVLPISAGFFASRATWYQVAFRCEIDADATRVLAFTFQVGREVPRSEWAARHFREF